MNADSVSRAASEAQAWLAGRSDKRAGLDLGTKRCGEDARLLAAYDRGREIRLEAVIRPAVA